MMSSEPQSLDIIAPERIAHLVEAVAVRKIGLSFLATFTLGILAGAFISFGAMAYTVVLTGSELGFGPTRLLGGMAFSTGLILVIVGGAELFTGNSLIVLAWASGRVGTAEIMRNWAIVYMGNLVGAFATAVLVHVSGVLNLGDGAVGATASEIVQAKIAMTPLRSFVRGILCNTLVCLAVWMCFAARSVPGKVAVIIPPITVFVMLGFEHSIANMYLLPVGMLHMNSEIDVLVLLTNLIPVTLGNIVGGGGFVALVYWLIYLRAPPGNDPV